MDKHFHPNFPPGHPEDFCAPDCDDQLPLFSTIGRGLKGDSYRVKLGNPDSHSETHLEGGYWDEADKTFHTEWISENINGGVLSYQYNIRPYTIPRTFTITFIYRRPSGHGHIANPDGTYTPTTRTHGANEYCGDGQPNNADAKGDDSRNECSWSWTTPAIPYIWTLDEAGKPETDPDHIVGSGVATLFVRTKHTNTNWNERLHYPPGTTRDDFNAPLPEKAWSSTITFGIGGDVEVPDLWDIAKILGVTQQDIRNILNDNSITIDGLSVNNIVDYIQKADNRLKNHIHADQGFGDNTLVGDNPNNKIPASAHPSGVAYNGTTYTNPAAGKPYTIKNYIDYTTWEAKLDLLALMEAQRVANQNKFNTIHKHINNIRNILNDLISKIFGTSQENASSTPSTDLADSGYKQIKWPTEPGTNDDKPQKIPIGNINVISSDRSKAILTHTGTEAGDIRSS